MGRPQWQQKILDAQVLAGEAWEETETLYAHLRALLSYQGDMDGMKAALAALLPEHPNNVERFAKRMEEGGLPHLAERWRAIGPTVGEPDA